MSALSKLLLTALFLTALGTGTAQASAPQAEARAPSAAELRRYMPRMKSEVLRYRAAIQKTGRAFEPGLLPATQLAYLRSSQEDFTRIAARLERVRRPASLRVTHGHLVGAVKRVSVALGRFLAAGEQFVRDKNETLLVERNRRAAAQLEEAERLQDRWANALRASARRAKVPIPAWLKNFRS